jgi:hypothetical protein
MDTPPGSRASALILQILTGSLYFILLGLLLLLITYLGVGKVPTALTFFNVAIILLLLLGVAAQLLGSDHRIDQFYRFCSSGLFFIFLGVILLFVAQLSMGIAHAGMTFVLVVLGVAVLLYGTGTQGMGELKTDTSAAKYNVAIAGGAGVLAFCVAIGIIWYSPKMRDAFQTEKKFVRVQIKSGDGLSNIPSYAPLFEIDGIQIPAARRGNLVEVFVPYMTSELAPDEPDKKGGPNKLDQPWDKSICKTPENELALEKLHNNAVTKTISATFHRVEPKDTLKAKEETDFRIKLDQSIFNQNDGGADYPIYPVKMCVNLQAQDGANRLASASGESLRPAAGKDAPARVTDSILSQIGAQ